MIMTQAEIDFEKISNHLNTKASEPWTWLFYGDSITHGALHTHGFRAFPEIFAERIRWEMRLLYDVVINTAISGQTTVQLLDESRFDWRVSRFNPNVVFILIGMNDIVKLKSAEKFKSNLLELVRRVRSIGANPVLQTNGKILFVPENEKYVMRYENLAEFNAVVRHVAAEESIILVDHEPYWNENAADEAALKRYLGEAIHPGGRGHLEMAKVIFKTFNIFDPECNSCNPVGTPWSMA